MDGIFNIDIKLLNIVIYKKYIIFIVFEIFKNKLIYKLK